MSTKVSENANNNDNFETSYLESLYNTLKESKKNSLPLHKSTLITQNIIIMGQRTSVRLEAEMWKALKDISKREKCTIHDICSMVYVCKKPFSSLTASIRVFLMLYYKAAATEDGHQKAKHGHMDKIKRQGLNLSSK